MEDEFQELQFFSKEIQLKLAKGELTWESEEVQFFIPAVLCLTDFDWLNIIAENILIEEDEIIVKNFLDQVQGLMQVNSENLNKALEAKFKKLFEE